MKSGEEPFECAAFKFFGDCGPHHGARPLENRDAFGDCAQRNAAARAVIVCGKISPARPQPISPSSPTTSALIGTARSSRSTRDLASLRLGAAASAQ
jgi:hypothetical protein